MSDMEIVIDPDPETHLGPMEFGPVPCPNCGSGDFTGLQDPAVYEGVLVWECSQCALLWPRWAEDHELYSEAQSYITVKKAEEAASE